MTGETRVPNQAAVPPKGGVVRRDHAHGTRRVRVEVLDGPRGDGPGHGERAGDIYAGRQRLQQVRMHMCLCMCFIVGTDRGNRLANNTSVAVRLKT